jgi:glycosyltransferase involved in cell wall biosynthesis
MMHPSEPMVKAGLIIPVFNVEKTILRVLSAITPDILQHLAEILIIDNHSSDRTVELITQYMAENPTFAARATLVLHAENYGYGGSIKSGFTHFLSRPVSHIILIHSDYQVDPHWLIAQLVARTQADSTRNLVMASRFMPGSDTSDYSLLRRLGNHFFNVLTFVCTGVRMSDSGAAMMMVRKDILAAVPFANLSNSLQFHPQLNILLYGMPGIRIQEFPMTWMDSDAPSSISLFQYGWDLLKMLLWYRFAKTILRKKPEDIFPHEPVRADRKFRQQSFGA